MSSYSRETCANVIEVLDEHTAATIHVQKVVKCNNVEWGGYYDDVDCAIYVSSEMSDDEYLKTINSYKFANLISTLLHEYAHYIYDRKHSGVELPKMRLIEEEAFADSFSQVIQSDSVVAGLISGKDEFDKSSRIVCINHLHLKHAKVDWYKVQEAIEIALRAEGYLGKVRRILHG